LKRNCYCTYFSYGFSPYGLALIESILKHDPYSRLFILCLDKNTFDLCSKIYSDKVTLINLHTLEESIPQLIEAKANRSITEYYWTLTPCIMHYLIFRIRACSTLTYLDADQYFYSDPHPVFKEIGDANMAIMPHRFPHELIELNTHGKFNVSWLTFRNTVEAKECLMWWMSSCIEWCYAKVDGSRYGDQKYLDQFPAKFNGVHVIQNTGCGLAPWNLSTYDYENEIILFHFQSFRIHTPYVFTVVIQIFSMCDTDNFKKHILRDYIVELKEKFNTITNYNKINTSDKSMHISSDSIIIIYIFGRFLFLRKQFFKSIFSIFSKISSKSRRKR
jgi:hypothetical protein